MLRASRITAFVRVGIRTLIIAAALGSLWSPAHGEVRVAQVVGDVHLVQVGHQAQRDWRLVRVVGDIQHAAFWQRLQ